MNLLSIITNLRIQDVLDVLLLTIVAYYLYRWFQGTKALKALIGLLVLGAVFTISRTWGLFMTTWVFQILWQVLVILLIILFQTEIRQVLERVNPLRAIGFYKSQDSVTWLPAFLKGISGLANRRIGALLIIERIDRVGEWITGGHQIQANPIPEVLLSIFQKESPLHDGAVIIRDGTIVMVSCYLPLSSSEGIPKKLGTRHRAALGLTEKCDACVVIVSEESGEISLARDGQLLKTDTPEQLSHHILDAQTPRNPQPVSWIKKVFTILSNRWAVKVGSFGLVCVLWLLLAGQQDFQVTLHIPLEVKNLPVTMEIQRPLDPEVTLTLRGLRKEASTLSEKNVHVEADLSLARFGRRVFSITRDQVILPNDRVHVVRIEPAFVEFELQEKQK